MATPLYSTPATSSGDAERMPFVPVLADSYSLDHKMIDCEHPSAAALFMPSLQYPAHRRRSPLKPRPTFTYSNTVVRPLSTTNRQQQEQENHRLVQPQDPKVIPHRPTSPTCCSSNLILHKPKALPNRHTFQLSMRRQQQGLSSLSSRRRLVLTDRNPQQGNVENHPQEAVPESWTGMMTPLSSSSTPRLPSLLCFSPGSNPLYLPDLQDN